MLQRLSAYLTNSMVESGEIDLADKELYQYGLEVGFSLLGTIITTTVIGLLMQQVVGALVFILAFVPLRSFAGGYHATTRLSCYLLSCAVTAGVLLLAQFPGLSEPFYVGHQLRLALCSGFLIALMAPVENPNKPLDWNERRVYARVAWVILGAEFLIYGGLLYTGHLYLALLLALNFAVMAATMFFGSFGTYI